MAAKKEHLATPKSKAKRPAFVQRFFRTESGNEPVREWFKTLPKVVRQEIGADLTNVHEFWPASNKLPLVGGLGSGLYEVRTSHDGNIFRTLFCFAGGEMILLHAFHKKTQKTPQGDLELARERHRLVSPPVRKKEK